MTEPFKYEKKEICYNTWSYKTTFIALGYGILIIFLIILLADLKDLIFGLCSFSDFIKRLVCGLCLSVGINLFVSPVILLRDFICRRTIRIEIEDDYFKVTKFPKLFFLKEKTTQIYYNEIKRIDSNRYDYRIQLKDSVFNLPDGSKEITQFMFTLIAYIRRRDM